VTELDWFQGFDSVQQGGFLHGDVAWFVNGKLNTCYNCLDRWIEGRGDQTAILWEGDEPTDTKAITYRECLRKVCQISNALKAQGVKKGDCVTIYMPMMPEVSMVMLACARIGAYHSVIFAGFSADAIADRIEASGSKWVVTADEGLRGGKKLPLKAICDQAMAKDACRGVVEKCFVFARTSKTVNMETGRDVEFDSLVAAQRPYCPCEPMDSEVREGLGGEGGRGEGGGEGGGESATAREGT
jgi:acetyl-CoA synthetase